MALEIERKFLLKNDAWRAEAGEGTRYRQAYIASGPPAAVRVRIAGSRALLNIKKASLDITRDEFEYPIPVADAEALADRVRVGALIEKTRYKIPQGKHTWEIDVFHGLNEGLIVAEIELDHAEETFVRPAWLGPEVSAEPRYLNACLALHPYTAWSQEEKEASE